MLGPAPVTRVAARPVLVICYWGLLLCLVLLIWIFPYFPTQDGPSHLFNAHVFASYEHVRIFQQAFQLQIPTAGNFAGHGLAILLLKAGFPWEACEKLLASLSVVGLALAFRYAVTAFSSVSILASFLVFPFLYNLPMQMGFWSFSLGVPFLLVSIGLYFRHRGNWKLASLLYLFLAAGAAYLCHPIPWAVCALTIGILAVGTEGPALLSNGTDRHRALVQVLLPIAAFVPFALPNLLFAERNNYVAWEHFSSIGAWLWPLYTDTPLRLFHGDERPARVLFLILLLGALGNFAWKLRYRHLQIADVVFPAAVVLLGIGLISPARIGEGTFLDVRLFLFGLLLWILWLAVTLPPRALQAGAALALLFTVWLSIARLPTWRTANRELKTFVQLGRVIPANAFVCQLDFLPPGETVRPFEHAIDLLPARDFVDVRDYEAGRFAFWTRFRPGYSLDEDYIHPASLRDFESALERFEQRTGRHVDYIVLTQFTGSSGAVLRRELPRRYREYQLVSERIPLMAIYRRSADGARSFVSTSFNREYFANPSLAHR